MCLKIATTHQEGYENLQKGISNSYGKGVHFFLSIFLSLFIFLCQERDVLVVLQVEIQVFSVNIDLATLFTGKLYYHKLCSPIKKKVIGPVITVNEAYISSSIHRSPSISFSSSLSHTCMYTQICQVGSISAYPDTVFR